MNPSGEIDPDLGHKVPKVIKNVKYSTQKEIESVSQERVTTSTVLPTNDRNLRFRIEPSSKFVTNLSLLSVRLHVSLRDRNGLPQESLRRKTFVPGPLPLSLFQDVKISANGTLITQAEGLYPFIGKYLALTRLSRQTKNLLRETAMFYDDIKPINPVKASTGKPKVTLTSSNFKDLDNRLELFSVDQKTPIELSFYLLADISHDKSPALIPPGVAIDIELALQSPRRAIVKLEPEDEIDPVWHISLAEILVTRIVPAHSIPKTIKQDYQKVRAVPLIIQKSTTVYRNSIQFSESPIPSRLFLTFLTNDAFDGRHSDNIFSSEHWKVSSIVFNVAGRRYPAQNINFDWGKDHVAELFLRSSEAMRFSLQSTGESFGTMKDYKNGDFKYAVDLSADYSSGSSWNVKQERGYLGIEITFATPLPERIVAVVISEVASVFSINANGEAQIE